MYLLFDIGATNMRFATSDGKKLEHVRIFPTPKDFDSATELFKKATAGMNSKKIKKIVGGVPRFNRGKPNFWYSNPTQKILEKIAKTKVSLVNDAELSALGEAVYGAGKGHEIVGYLTFSTGFGGARIVNQKIDANSFGFEPDHQLAQYDPKKKTSPRIGEFASGRGILDRYGKNPERIKAKKVWSEIENWMGVALTNTAVYWSPEIIVIGGAISGNKNISSSRLQTFLEKKLGPLPSPKIIKGTLGQLSGLYGALALAKQKKKTA